MPFFDVSKFRLFYRDEGSGQPVILVHGFASNSAVNWVNTGWVDWLVGAGHRVLALDVRGHGQSTPSYDLLDYEAPKMASDVIALLDQLGLERADMIGYSMGARIVAFAALSRPDRVRRAVFGGLAGAMITGMSNSELIAHALEAPGMDALNDGQARAYRRFAEKTNSDLRALAACIRASRRKITANDLQRLTMPILVATGAEDQIAGSPELLRPHLHNARFENLPGRDHMSAVGDIKFKKAVQNFLADAQA